MPISSRHILPIAALICSCHAASGLTPAALDGFLAQKEVKGYLQAHSETRSKLREEMQEYKKLCIRRDTDQQIYNNGLQSLQGANSFAAPVLRTLVDNNLNDLRQAQSSVNDEWATIEEIYNEIRQGVASEPPVNQSEAGPSLSGETPLAANANQTPAPSAASSSGGPSPVPAVNRWPDGKVLLHPEHYVITHVVTVTANDTLKLRAAPGTQFDVVANIPFDANNIKAFDQDQVWDGDTWWCPVEWRGYRGYVGRSKLPR